jgi:hypothetical protein
MLYKIRYKLHGPLSIVSLGNIGYHILMKLRSRGKIGTLNTQINDRSLSWIGTGTLIKSGRFELVIRLQNGGLYSF